MIHDILKIKYVKLGYIKKNYPYHLISDEEMFNAFIDLNDDEFNTHTTMIDPKVRFFDDYYPNPFADHDVYYEKKNAMGEVIDRISLSGEYTSLKNEIIKSINLYLTHKGMSDAAEYQIPNWIYTYMLGEVVYKNSEYLDIYDILKLLGCSNVDNEFTQTACAACYVTSLSYISTLTNNSRPPTVFGEPHVIKALRLKG